MAQSIVKQSTIICALRILARPGLWKAAFCAVSSIQKNFFILQKNAYKKKINIPAVYVDHPLDEKIPFTPAYIAIYMDFSSLWIRALVFLLHRFGKKAVPQVKDFLYGLAGLYTEAAKVYTSMMSTTRRPCYHKLGTFKSRLKNASLLTELRRSFLFKLIYKYDPHLMCIPSLHVMVIIFTYTRVVSSLRVLRGAEPEASETGALYEYITAICDSILFVKQHSVNCVAAGLYAVHRVAPDTFSAADAAWFTGGLLRGALGMSAADAISSADKDAIRAHINGLFDSFVRAGKDAASWDAVLSGFLRGLEPR